MSLEDSAPNKDTMASSDHPEIVRDVAAVMLTLSWVAVSLNGKPFTGERPSFKLDVQLRATGFSGCNTYATAAYPLREQGLAVGPFALTKRSCDKTVMAIEQAFLVALRSSAKWDIQGRNLIIQTQNGGELRLERSL